MSAVAVAPGELHPTLRTIVEQVLVLARRSVMGTLRQPAMWMPTLFFPLFIAAVNTSTMGRAVHIPGFPPVDSMLDFLLASAVTHGVLFGGVTAGSDTAVDIQEGFFDRLLASPVPRTTILVGRLAGAAVLGAFQALLFTAIFMAFGTTLYGGIGALVVLMAYAMLLALFVGGFAATVALRTGQAEAVQNAFPLTFILLFVSSAFFPVELMKGVYRSVAENNPITWMIDGVRHQVVAGFDLAQAAQSLGVAAVLAAVTVTMANAALRARVRSAA